MRSHFDNLPEEIVEKIYLYVWKDKIADVNKQLLDNVKAINFRVIAFIDFRGNVSKLINSAKDKNELEENILDHLLKVSMYNNLESVQFIYKMFLGNILSQNSKKLLKFWTFYDMSS